MSVVTRFAPSPTGLLHIGGVRTALYNVLFARKHGGRFLLRIDDTDRERSTQAAVDAILDGLNWLGITWDGEITYQHQRLARHAEIAQQLLAEGKAYRCWATQTELEEMRRRAAKAGKAPRYDGRWRDRDPSEAPEGQAPVIRLKAPQTGHTVIPDLVVGDVKFANSDLDDFILLRADGSPTYMLSTVVDDHDLGVTHVIRGNDHLTNAARQVQIYDAMGWPRPQHGHIPLIHGADGAKLSKRHGAVGVDWYRDQGYLPEAVNDYLMRLGWAPGTDEPLSLDQAAERFDLGQVSRGPARFDQDAVIHASFNAIKHADNTRLAVVVAPFVTALVGRDLTADETSRLAVAMPGLKERAKTLPHLAETAAFFFRPRPIPVEPAAAALLTDAARALLTQLRGKLVAVDPWDKAGLDQAIKAQVAEAGVKFPALGQPLRAALTGRTNSPAMADVMAVLGREESLGRLDDALTGA